MVGLIPLTANFMLEKINVEILILRDYEFKDFGSCLWTNREEVYNFLLNRGFEIFWLIYEFKRIDISSIFRISKVCVLCYFRNLELTRRCRL